jgi:hypothetical protein
MSYAKAIGRLGLLAVGLGIGGAVAATPGIAAADTTDVDAAAFDPSALIGDPAPADSGLNLAISVDGLTVFQSGTANAYSEIGNFSVAYGDGSTASAGDPQDPGIGDVAFADGDGSSAYSGIGDFDSATAIGSGSQAVAYAGSGDSALADGTDTTAIVSGEYTSGTPNTVDLATNDSYASAIGNGDFAYAGSGLPGEDSPTAATGDIATIFGDNSEAYSGVGNFDLAEVLGSGSEASAGLGNFDLAGVLGDSLTATASDGSYLFDFMPSL